MKRTGLIVTALLCLPGGAFAACESPTDKLKSGTVAFMCPPEAAPQARIVVTVPQANVSVVQKAPEAIPDMPLPPAADDLTPEKVEDLAAATPVPADNPIKVKSSKAKPEKKKSKSKKKTRTAAKKSSTPKSGRIIHLEKPSLGRRIVQFFGG